MGRAAKYDSEAILDAALALASEHGPLAVSVVAIAKLLNAPSGSIYHRFASRDLILATLWIRTIKKFQTGFLAAMSRGSSEEAARAAIAHTLEWTAEHPHEAKLLVLYRRADLLAFWPDELGDELTTLNDGVEQSITAFTHNHFGVANAETTGLSYFALVAQPYAAARQIISSGEPPQPWLVEAVTVAALAVLKVRVHQ